MWKHIVVSSFQAALVGATILILVGLPSFGAVSIVFGLVAFPIAGLLCVILAYPLIRLRQEVELPEYAHFSIFVIVGFISGALTTALLFGAAASEFSTEAAGFLGLYGLLGATCAVSAWNYIRKKIFYNRVTGGL